MAKRLPKLFKRCPYRDYREKKVRDVIPDILDRLRNAKFGDISVLSEETGIPNSTLGRWYKNLQRMDFDPLQKQSGKHQRIFTDSEENSIAQFIKDNYITPSYYFTDEDFRDIAFSAWREKYFPILDSEDPEVLKSFKDFHCSDGFVFDFKSRHRFSSKRFHTKRRPQVFTEREQNFVKEIKELKENVPRGRILNCDETGWLLTPKGILTWSETNIDIIVRQSNTSDKDSITVLATVAFDRTKLPLHFIAKGLTEYVEGSQLGDVMNNWKAHSESGWINKDIF